MSWWHQRRHQVLFWWRGRTSESWPVRRSVLSRTIILIARVALTNSEVFTQPEWGEGKVGRACYLVVLRYRSLGSPVLMNREVTWGSLSQREYERARKNNQVRWKSSLNQSGESVCRIASKRKPRYEFEFHSDALLVNVTPHSTVWSYLTAPCCTV